MKSTVGQMSSSQFIQSLSPENKALLQKGLKLLGLKDWQSIPGSEEPYQICLMIGGLANLIGRHGEQWVIDNKERLLKELEYISEL